MDIDFVITWVDGEDSAWIKQKRMYENKVIGDNSDIRFRDMNLLRYWFRGIEKYISWVHKIFFVTCGQKPYWLNEKHDKLVMVNHNEFIPCKYLPTFSSHPIELNLHRIKNLSDTFVYFNDDIFVINKMEKKDFFRQKLPCDYGVISPIIPREDIQNITLNVMRCINSEFNVKDVIRSNISKWFSIQYGKDVIRNVFFSLWPAFIGFKTQHMPNAYNKSTFVKVWERFPRELDNTCSHKFRDIRDVNHWLMQYWQIVSGEFSPLKKNGVYLNIDQIDSLKRVLNSKDYKMLCLNDKEVEDFSLTKKRIQSIFEEKFPCKSSFEI